MNFVGSRLGIVFDGVSSGRWTYGIWGKVDEKWIVVPAVIVNGSLDTFSMISMSV
jgi:hypothetical protein